MLLNMKVTLESIINRTCEKTAELLTQLHTQKQLKKLKNNTNKIIITTS